MSGMAWYILHKGNDIKAIRKWCVENLTPDTWYISEMQLGVYDTCIGIDDEAMAFKLMWSDSIYA